MKTLIVYVFSVALILLGTPVTTQVAQAGQTHCMGVQSDQMCETPPPCVFPVPCKDVTVRSLAVLATPGWHPNYGTNAATAHSQFPLIQNYNFYLPSINAAFANLSDPELATLTRQYYTEAGSLTPLLNIAARTLSAANLQRLASAAGHVTTGRAVNAYASPEIKNAYFVRPQLPALATSVAWHQSMGVVPLGRMVPNALPLPPLNPAALDMTLYEIYLDYRTSAAALTVTSALFATTAWSVYAIGGIALLAYEGTKGVYAVVDTIRPGTTDAINSHLAIAMQDVVNYIWVPDTRLAPSFDTGSGVSITIDWGGMTDQRVIDLSY